MRAVVATEYGGPEAMTLVELPDPVAGPGEVRLRVAATTLQALDWHLLRGEPLPVRASEGLRAPKRTIHGVDLAGTVLEVGEGVGELAVGDEVVGWAEHGGGLAEQVVVQRDHLHPRPTALTLEEGATLGVAAFTALQALRDHGELAAGERVAIVGASGGVGHFAVQMAKAMGGHVIGVCSTRNVAMVRDLGADAVIDRTTDDWTEAGPFDLVVQVAGDTPVRDVLATLRPGGRFVLVGMNRGGPRWGMMGWFVAAMLRAAVDRRMRTFTANENADDLAVLVTMAERGELRPVVDRTFPLADAAEAMRFVEAGHASGKVLVVP